MARGGLAQANPFACAANAPHLDQRVKKNEQVEVY
jgi:hypothetical protein